MLEVKNILLTDIDNNYKNVHVPLNRNVRKYEINGTIMRR